MEGKRKHDSIDVSLSWRGDPSKTFSDWDISLTNSDDGSETTYHVHRNILSCGPRRCGYFRGVFDAQTQEQNDSTSKIDFDSLFAECFPQFLDYVYYEQVDYNAENALGIRHLADYFACEALKTEVDAFIREGLPKNAPFYYQRASESNDNEIKDLARAYLIDNLGHFNADAFDAYPAELFRSIVFHPALMSPKLGFGLKRFHIKSIWNSYAAANPHLPGDLREERHKQVCNFDLGTYSRMFPLAPDDRLRVLAGKLNILTACSRSRKYWSELDLDDLMEVDGSVNPGTTILANLLDQSRTDYNKVVSEKDDLKTENDVLKKEVASLQAQLKAKDE